MTVMYGTTCEGLVPPRIFYAPLDPNTGGLYYRGKDYVILNGYGVRWASNREIAFHEAVHFIYDNNVPYVSSCDSERAARRATAVFMGRAYSSAWEKIYGCG